LLSLGGAPVCPPQERVEEGCVDTEEAGGDGVLPHDSTSQPAQVGRPRSVVSL